MISLKKAVELFSPKHWKAMVQNVVTCKWMQRLFSWDLDILDFRFLNLVILPEYMDTQDDYMCYTKICYM